MKGGRGKAEASPVVLAALDLVQVEATECGGSGVEILEGSVYANRLTEDVGDFPGLAVPVDAANKAFAIAANLVGDAPHLARGCPVVAKALVVEDGVVRAVAGRLRTILPHMRGIADFLNFRRLKGFERLCHDGFEPK